MKTSATIAVSSVLGFITVFLCVPRREPESIPPSWFELPGQPVSLDGQPTHTWEEVNEALRGISRDHLYMDEQKRSHGTAPAEIDGPRVQVTYVPSGRRGGDHAHGVESVTVRPFFPTAVPWSRALDTDLLRYEIERPNAIN